MRRRSAITCLATGSAGLLLAFVLPHAVAADLECHLSIPARVQMRAAIPLTFELVNRGKATLNVLNWDTPLEGFFGQYLRITGPAGEVDYRGPVVKRATPTREEYVSIKRGARIKKTLNLAPGYDFKTAGRHEIAFTGKLVDATNAKIPRAHLQHTPMTIDCPTVTFELAAAR